MFNRTGSIVVMMVATFIVAMKTYAAEPQSSLFKIEFFGPAINVNSSQRTDTCIVVYNKDSSSGDLHFRYDSISSDYGILYDETVDSRIKSLINPNIFDSEAKFYFDLMLSKELLTAPQSGYTSSVPAGKTAYFIKTSPTTYGLIINYYNYIGGINRSSYYLVKNDEGGSRLFKEEIQELPSSLSFVVQVFSGRIDPIFTIKNQANIKKLIYAIYNTTDYVRNPSLVLPNPASWPPLQTFLITEIFNGCSGSNIQVKVARGMVSITRGSKIVYMKDFSSSLYLTMIDAGRDENLVSIDQYGPVYFRDLFPLVNNNKDTVRGTISVKSGSKVVIKDIDGYETAAGYKLYVVTGGADLYRGGVIQNENGFALKDTFSLQNVDAGKISSVIQLQNVVYIGTEKGVFKSINGSPWSLESTGIPADNPVTSLFSDDSNTVYAVVGEDASTLYCKKTYQNTWENVFEKYSITADSPVENLPENIPFAIRKFYLSNCHFVTTGDSIYKPLKNSLDMENWSISSVVKVGSAIIASTNSICNECSSPSMAMGVVLKSLDNGKTFKVVMKCRLASEIKLVTYGQKVFLNLELIPSSIKPDFDQGLYISDDYGTNWSKFDVRLPIYNTGRLKIIGDYLCLAEDSGSFYMIALGNIQFAPGPTHIQVPELNTAYKLVPVTVGNKIVTFRVPCSASDLSLSICNLQGKVIQKISQKNNARYSFNGSVMSRGMYLLRVEAGDFLETKQILVK